MDIQPQYEHGKYGTWSEKTPQIASVWGTTFDVDKKYENKKV